MGCNGSTATLFRLLRILAVYALAVDHLGFRWVYVCMLVQLGYVYRHSPVIWSLRNSQGAPCASMQLGYMGGTLVPRTGLWGTQSLLVAGLERVPVVPRRTVHTLLELYRSVVEPLTQLRRGGPTSPLAERDHG